MESIMYRHQDLEASFSFNSSALHVFSDDDVDAAGGSDDDEYIEIALEQKQKQPTNYNCDGDGDDELELRISFSSSSYCDDNICGRNTGWETKAAATPASSLSCYSSAELFRCRGGDDDDQPLSRSLIKRTMLKFRPAVNRLLNGFFSTPTMMISEQQSVEGEVSSDGKIITRQGTADQTNIKMPTSGYGLIRHAGENKMTRASPDGGTVMSLLIKCRSMSIRALVASFLKPYRIVISSSSPHHRGNRIGVAEQRKKKKKAFEKWLVTRDKPSPEDCKRSANNCYSDDKNSMAAVLQQGDSSCSVQAAIAHCKRSFGQTSEFRF